MQCAVCNVEFEVRAVRKKTCSTQCAIEHERRRRRKKELRRKKRLWRFTEWRAREYQRRQAGNARRNENARVYYLARRTLTCRGCGTDISHIKYARYCGPACRPTKAKAPKVLIHRSCRECGTSTVSPRIYCEDCRLIINYRNQKRAHARRRPHDLDKRIKMFAAVRVFKQLHQGKLKPEATKSTKYYQARCVICGILITAWRRSMTCSETCAQERDRERARFYYYGERPYEPARPPPEIRRKMNHHKYRQKETQREKEREKQRIRSKQPGYRDMRRKQEAEWRAIHAAFRQLNLLPK